MRPQFRLAAEAWREVRRQRALIARKCAMLYAALYVALFVLWRVPGPSWMHWSEFLIGAWCGALAFKYWGDSATLRDLLDRTRLPPLE